MVDYKKMYHVMCAAASKAVDLMPDIPANNMARMALLEALNEAEDIYIDNEETSPE